ncbi:hypothetical protein AFK24_09955 [Pseudomonas syringae]|uniref:DUF2169 domain-containing protein n=1 Tax=Pseudomonas syringae TaxID=317 RepID=A0A1C7Z4Y4_PSESX|nr:DUF2169 domain-containing protein [Pseudomonas syringae]OCR25102.1 hypothetical protein AFK24_09955 [Pseudomonas syringae]
MHLNDEHVSSLSVSRYRGHRGPCMVVTVGVLYGADQNIVPANETQAWLNKRFGKQPFDRGMKKSRGTFAVQGSAYAANVTQQDGMAVRVRMGELDKILHVHPPRQWHKGLLGWSPLPSGVLTVLPLELGLAYGGAGSQDNPDGIGYVLDAGQADGLALPQIESPATPLRAPGERAPVASFLPLAPQSSERRAFLGTCDEAWKKLRAPFVPMDTDPRWFDEVAQDQCQQGYWSGHENWLAQGMHPTQAQVAGRLPGLRLRLFVQRHALGPTDAGVIEETALDLDTVWLFPDEERLLLLYRVEVDVVDIDGDDLAGLAAVCERLGEEARTAEHWKAELWRQRPAKASSASPTPEPFEPGPHAASQALSAQLPALMAEVSKQHASYGVELEKLGAQAASTPAVDMDTGQLNFVTLVEPLKQRTDCAHASLATELNPLAGKHVPPAAAPLADQTGIEALEAATAQWQAGLEQQMAELNRLLEGMPPDVLAQLHAQQLAGSLSLNQSMSGAELAALQASMEASNADLAKHTALLEAELAQLQKDTAALDPAVFAPVPPEVKPAWTRELLQAACDARQALDGVRLVALDLSGMNLIAVNLGNCVLQGCKLNGAALGGSNFNGAQLTDCDLSDADLAMADFANTMLERCVFQRIKAAQLNLADAYVADCDFTQADLSASKAMRGSFTQCRFNKALMQAVDWSGARWSDCDLSGAGLADSQLGKTQMRACQLDAVSLRAADLHQADWSDVIGSDIDLSNAHLQNWRVEPGCQLPGIRLDGADLTQASLQAANLSRASLRNACLARALVMRCNLSDSDAYRVDARGADLSSSDLSRAQWVGANLFEARLRKVRLEGADLSGSNLHGVNSEGARGLGARLEGALMTRCRLTEDLANA